MKKFDYSTFKQEVLAKKIGRKSASLSELRLISDSAIDYNGVILALSPQGFSSLLKMLNISKQLRTNLIKQYGAGFADNLVSTLSRAMGVSKDNVILLIDQRKRTVINIVASSESMISNESFLNNVENIIGDSKLEIDSMVVRDNGGFTISTVGDNSEWGLTGVESTESFKFGLNFDNDPVKGTRLMPYNQRLICTNGMIGQGFVGVHQLENNKSSWDEFYNKIDTLKKDNFKPIEFSSTLKSIMTSDASLAYRTSGKDIEEFNKDQKKNAKTDVSYWDLVNGITDFASHNYGYSVSNPDNLQRFAGRMFVKKPDLTNLVVNPFK